MPTKTAPTLAAAPSGADLAPAAAEPTGPALSDAAWWARESSEEPERARLMALAEYEDYLEREACRQGWLLEEDYWPTDWDHCPGRIG